MSVMRNQNKLKFIKGEACSLHHTDSVKYCEIDL